MTVAQAKIKNTNSNSNNGNVTTAKNNGKDYFGKVIKLDFKFRTLMVK